jgi:glycosyltransferase involved in cell wall biosynthesis
MSNSKISIGAFIITKNEEDAIGACIDALTGLDQLLVYDSGSTDRTVSIASSKGADVILDPIWNGFGAQKQKALTLMRTTHVLSIDADEIVTAEFREFLESLKDLEGLPTEASYYVKRINFFLGRPMKYGYFRPDSILRFGPKAQLCFDGKPVHEKLVTSGPTLTLNYDCIHHHSRRSVAQVISKQIAYQDNGALYSTRPPHYFSLIGALGAWLKTFIGAYMLRLGLLDGPVGFIAAVSRAQSRFWSRIGRN